MGRLTDGVVIGDIGVGDVPRRAIGVGGAIYDYGIAGNSFEHTKIALNKIVPVCGVLCN